MRQFLRLLSDEQAATSIEYGLVVALIALGLVATVNTVGARVADVFTTLSAIGNAPPPGNAGNGA